jgi:AcrB/AcrD/AcrF family
MTSFAFILGVFPLVIATGAGAASRRSIGIAVFSGMIASTCLAVVFVPSFYVVLQRHRPRRSTSALTQKAFPPASGLLVGPGAPPCRRPGPRPGGAELPGRRNHRAFEKRAVDPQRPLSLRAAEAATTDTTRDRAAAQDRR